MHTRFAMILTISLITPLTVAEAEDACQDVLRYAARNETIEAYSYQAALNIYNQHCQSDQLKSSDQLTVGVEATIEAIPLGINIGSGSTEQKMSSFCKSFYERKDVMETRYGQSRLVNADSIRAWRDCIEMSARGVRFKPTMGRTVLNVEVARTTGDDLSILGVIADPSALECKARQGDKMEVADENTFVDLPNSKIWSLVCKRLPATDGEGKDYPESELNILTSQGNLLLSIPSETKMAARWATEFASQMAALNEKLSSVPTNLSCGIATGSFSHNGDVGIARIPEKTKLTGGGCIAPLVEGHRPTIHQSGPLADGTGWQCAGGDPPGIPIPSFTGTTYALFCQMARN